MADKSTFIKLDRNMLNWKWYRDSNTMRVFVHLILTANIKKNGFNGINIMRGQVVTSYPSLSLTLKISENSVRTAFSHLKSTGEITVKTYSKFSVVTIVNYNLYQDKSQSEIQSSHSQATVKPQSSHTNQRNKEYKNIRRERVERAPSAPPTLENVKDYFSSESLNGSPDRFFSYYSDRGWNVTDWKQKARDWSIRENSRSESDPKKDTGVKAAYDIAAFEKMLNEG